MEEKKGCNVINHYYGCCCKGSDNENEINNDSTPVGTVISYMGMKAPKHYLACDGAIYNIAEYKIFSDFIKEEYGAFDFFGGDGTTTFAVPDLRNEFLRGYHGDKEEKLSGEIGAHQAATNHLGFDCYGGSVKLLQARASNSTVTISQSNVDSAVLGTNWRNHGQSSNGNDTGGISTYTSRPVNTAVLYCIKYE